jgi:hypothetical protein
LDVRIGECGIGGDGFLIAGNGVCDLSAQEKLIAGIECEGCFLPADGVACEVGALAAVLGGLGPQGFGLGAELLGFWLISCGFGCVC